MNTTTNRRYVLQDMLGQGGMGAVFLAQDRLTKKLIALKRIKLQGDPRQDTPGSDFQVAMSNEFRVQALLRHPPIIKVQDYAMDAGQPYFTVELLDNPKTLLDGVGHSHTDLGGEP